MEILLIGLNHRTAPVEIRERVAFNADQAREATEQLRAQGILEESLVLSTCNRSELYGVPPGPGDDAAGHMEGFLASFHRLSPAELNGCLYRHNGLEAVRHVFRVAAGLDSMLLGEAEILGQVREAYRQALEQGATGPLLNRMFQGALEVGKRVRAETEIGTRPVSVAFAGVKLAERIFGNLRNHRALILGAGAMGQQVVEHLRNRGIAAVWVANRSRAHAEELAQRVNGDVVDWGDLARVLNQPDVIIGSVGGSEAVLTRALIEQAMAARNSRPLFVIDLGVPRNVEASVAGLYNVFLYNIDDLTEIVEHNKKAREEEIPRAELIIQEHVQKFEAWRAGIEMAALLQQLRAKFDRERQAFLREHLEQRSPEERLKAERLLEGLLERIVLEPVERLRSIPELRRRIQDLEALRDLFDLDKEKP